MLCGLAGGCLNLSGSSLGHCVLFGNDNCLLLFGSLCSCESGIECCNLCCEIVELLIGLIEALLFSLNNGLLLLFNNSLLFGRSLCSSISSIELVHFGSELGLLCGLCSAYLCGLGHCLLFGNDNSLLLFGSLCSCESGIECCDFSCESGVASITSGNALLFSLNDCLLLLFNNSLLFGGSRSSSISGVELVHFGFKLNLLGSLSGANLCGLGHCLLLGKNDSLLFFGSISSCESGIERCDLGSELVEVTTVTTLLCLDNGLLLRLDNNVLFFGGICSHECRIQRVHFGLELNLLLGQGRGSACGLDHRLLFGLNYSMLCSGSLRCCESGIECKNFCIDLLVGGASCCTLLFSLDNGLLLSLENGLLFVIRLSSLHCGVEGVHVRLELHLICGLNVGLNGKEHCSLFFLDDSLLFCGSLSSLHCTVELNDLVINSGGSSGVSSKNLLFGLNNSLLFFGSVSSSKSSVERKDFGLNLCFSFFSGKAASGSAAYYYAGSFVYRSGSLKSLLLCNDLSLLFTLDLSIDLSFGKSGLDIFLFFGSLSGIHSKLESQDIGLNSCQLCSTLVCLLLQLGSFLVSLLLFLDVGFDLLAAISGFSKAFTFVGEEDLFGSFNSIVGDDGSHNGGIHNSVISSLFGINDELVFVLFSKLGLNVCILRSFLITVHQHVLNTADDVGRVVDKVCNNLYGGKLFRRHGDHIHLALGGDGQKANGNDTYAGSTATAKVFLSSLRSGQVQATGCNTHGELGNRNNHHTGRGNDLLTYNGVRINNRANLFQRIADYFLDRRFVFHNE